MLRMALKTLTAANAAALDKELVSTHAFSIDQLMELAGLSVSQAVYRLHPPSSGRRVLVVCGPGNNGGDGLVAARHLRHFGYTPTVRPPPDTQSCPFLLVSEQADRRQKQVHYPKQSKSELYQRLVTQLQKLQVPFATSFSAALGEADHVVDAVFGFSFSGEVREPFPGIIAALETTAVPVLAVDAPSSWNVDDGPPAEGPGAKFRPQALISLTAPKPLVKFFEGRHFVGGRFLPPELAEKFGLDVPPYDGVEQVVEVDKNGHKL